MGSPSGATRPIISPCGITGDGPPTGSRGATIVPPWSGGGPIDSSTFPCPGVVFMGLGCGWPGAGPLAVLEKLAFGCAIPYADSEKSL